MGSGEAQAEPLETCAARTFVVHVLEVVGYGGGGGVGFGPAVDGAGEDLGAVRCIAPVGDEVRGGESGVVGGTGGGEGKGGAVGGVGVVGWAATAVSWARRQAVRAAAARSLRASQAVRSSGRGEVK